MNIINARIMLIENCLSILFILFGTTLLNFHLLYPDTVIVLFKVVLLILMSTNTDLEWGVTNYSKIDTNFTSFCYFVGKFLLHCAGVYRKRLCVMSGI